MCVLTGRETQEYRAFQVFSSCGKFAIRWIQDSLDNVNALSLGEGHGCALLADTTVWCWGSKSFMTAPWLAPYKSPIVVTGLAKQECGDGAIGVGESCDDGNLEAGDGCSGQCEIEPGYRCFHTPSLCYAEGSGRRCDVAIPLEPGRQYQGAFFDYRRYWEEGGLYPFSVRESEHYFVNGVHFKLTLAAYSKLSLNVDSTVDIELSEYDDCPRDKDEIFWRPSCCEEKCKVSIHIINEQEESKEVYLVLKSYGVNPADFTVDVGPVSSLKE